MQLHQSGHSSIVQHPREIKVGNAQGVTELHEMYQRCLSRETGLALAFKPMMAAQKKWWKLDGRNRLPEVIIRVAFRDGVSQIQNAA